MLKSIKAVIFDMDGILVDSEPIHFETDQIQFEKYGEQYNNKLQKQFLGTRVIDQMKYLRSLWKLTPSIKKLMAEREKIFIKLIRKKLKLFNGTKYFLKHLKSQKIPLGIGTSAESWYLEEVMRKFNLSSYFSSTVNGDQITKGKPDPETYLKVATKLEVDPSNCIVFEDAVSGVEAAKAAGMICFAIPNKYAKDADYSIADNIFSSISEANQFFEDFL